MEPYDDLTIYYGDLHSHCAVGYGHGTLEEAFQNARMQLDFAAITIHAHWLDMPVGEYWMADLVDYHQRGFQISDDSWQQVQTQAEANNQPGEFVTFLGYEWHSNEFGDHNVYFNGSEGDIVRAPDLEAMRQTLRMLRVQGIDSLLIPHHIGYKKGFRGINWDVFDPEFSPVVEIMSMHGASESPEAPYPYLYTMGPRDWQSMYQYGLAQGHIAGAIGSSDHHSAHPGSYGHGKLAVWAKDLSRHAIWEAITTRRTYAITGDRIGLSFSLNEQPMGSILPPASERHIKAAVVGGDAIDTVDLLLNNRIIKRVCAPEIVGPEASDPFAGPLKLHFEVGWGQNGELVDWEVELEIVDGRLLDVEPRFRGQDVFAPQEGDQEAYAFSHWQREGDTAVQFSTRTWGNTTITSPGMQGICLTVSGSDSTVIQGQVNGKEVEIPLKNLLQGPISGYVGGFNTPAYVFHKAVPEEAYSCEIDFSHQVNSETRDWYTLRVRQVNGQYAWSSPIWINP